MRPARILGLALLGSIALSALRAQETPTPAPPPAAPVAPTVVPTATPPPTATPVPSQRLVDSPVISISRLPAENPYGLPVEEPAALTGKPAFLDAPVSAPLFVAVRVDSTGKVTQSRIARDPIPSMSAESKKSLDRWSFDPAVKGGSPVETWASLRLDMQVEVRAPRTEQPLLTPVTAVTAIPVPFQWGSDTAWYDNLTAAVPSDGTVAVEQLDALSVPKRTKWSADSYRGPFFCRFWVKVGANGRIEKSIPIQTSDPILIAYMRRVFPSWQLNPARVKGHPVESWNELSISGQIAYSIEIKQIRNLRKTLPGG
jgi:hypothetical protein